MNRVHVFITSPGTPVKTRATTDTLGHQWHRDGGRMSRACGCGLARLPGAVDCPSAMAASPGGPPSPGAVA